MDVSVRELKNHLSEYLRRTQAGEEITIASRGRPVGRLLPPLAREQADDGEALARLLAIPGIRRGSGDKLSGGEPATPVPSGTAAELLDWVRGG